jgi:hypothetical protein
LYPKYGCISRSWWLLPPKPNESVGLERGRPSATADTPFTTTAGDRPVGTLQEEPCASLAPDERLGGPHRTTATERPVLCEIPGRETVVTILAGTGDRYARAGLFNSPSGYSRRH